MKQINEPYALFEKLCAAQTQNNTQPRRWSRYALRVPCSDGALLYHTLTGELLLLSAEELRDAPQSEQLFARWFLVPESLDEYQMAQNFRAVAASFAPKKEGITSFTIFPTTDCNARCYYCYELGRKRQNMSKTVAEDTAAYITKAACGQKVELCWFGGEPLYNAEAIDVICTKLRENDVKFRSKMVTNGYFFTEKTVEKAKKLWNLTAVQITLDGTEEVYNKTKAYVDHPENAFLRVLQNIEYLLKNEVKTTIRLNVSSENEENMFELVDFVSARFSQNPRPEIYVAPLRDFSRNSLKKPNVSKLKDYVLSKKLGKIKTIQSEMFFNRCMADNDHSLTVLPDGRLGKCEHESENNLVGSIYKNLEPLAIARWKERISVPACKTCALFPRCIALKYCAWDAGDCTEEDQAEKLLNIQSAILTTYESKKSL